MYIQRNDIMVVVTKSGDMWIAQGGPASVTAHTMLEIDDCEPLLYHSQLDHRVAYHDGERYRVGTPTEARKCNGTKVKLFGKLSGRSASGSPLYRGNCNEDRGLVS